MIIYLFFTTSYNEQFEVFGVDAEAVAAALLDKIAFRHRPDESAITRRLCADHGGALVILALHHPSIAAVGNLSFPDPAARIVIKGSHVAEILLFWRHRHLTVSCAGYSDWTIISIICLAVCKLVLSFR
jgi:hypothetical protein